MADLNKFLTPLYLSDKEIKKIMELLFFSYRDFISGPDEILEKIRFGRAHHRIIYFVGKKNNNTIKDLLSILQITKQSLSRVLNELVNDGYITVSVGNDRRTKNLSLTQKGINLENKLSNIQIFKIRNIIKKAEEKDINGFKRILYDMIEEKSKRKFNELNK